MQKLQKLKMLNRTEHNNLINKNRKNKIQQNQKHVWKNIKFQSNESSVSFTAARSPLTALVIALFSSLKILWFCLFQIFDNYIVES